MFDSVFLWFFLESLFRSIFGWSNILYSGNIFESQELFDKVNDFIESQELFDKLNDFIAVDYEYQLQCIPHDLGIEELPIDYKEMCNQLR